MNKFLRDEKGIESTEVALIIAAVVLVAYGAYVLLGNKINIAVTDVADKV
jgi:Flp pilus assembly pilin Flp